MPAYDVVPVSIKKKRRTGGKNDIDLGAANNGAGKQTPFAQAMADEVTEEYAAAMEEAIASATKAEAEANRLKRKYEPDEPEVLLDKILKMSNDYDSFYMRVQIFTG